MSHLLCADAPICSADTLRGDALVPEREQVGRVSLLGRHRPQLWPQIEVVRGLAPGHGERSQRQVLTWAGRKPTDAYALLAHTAFVADHVHHRVLRHPDVTRFHDR
jgi:hypothetical protein